MYTVKLGKRIGTFYCACNLYMAFNDKTINHKPINKLIAILNKTGCNNVHF